jgi:predicted transcriptional regulator
MARVNVFREADDLTGPAGAVLDGWFDDDKAEVVEETTRWNGNNHVSVHTVDQFAHQRLYRTAGGRWVRNCWSQRVTVPETYEFLTDEQARTWLLVNESDGIIEKYLGEPIAEERGPGRPAVGRPVNVRFSEEVIEDLDGVAAAMAQSRADAIRDAVAAYFCMLDGTSATLEVELQRHDDTVTFGRWVAMAPPEVMRYPAFPGAGDQLAHLVALNRPVPDGVLWRVVVRGDLKTPGGNPSIHYPPSTSEVDDDEQG